jgi:hypothetical protein
MEMRESMILDVLCFGQCFTGKIIGPDGINRLYPLAAGRMTYVNPLSMYLPPDPPLMWRYADPTSGERVLLSDDLWTVRMLAPGGTINGQALVLLAREATDGVPGSGKCDKIPAMLEPGEGVVPGGVMDGLRNMARSGTMGGGSTYHAHGDCFFRSGVFKFG